MNVFRKRLRAEFGKKVYRHFVSLCKEELDQKKNKVPEEQIKANEKVVYSEMCEQLQSLTKEEIEKKKERLAGTLMDAFRIARQFSFVFVFYVIASLILAVMGLDARVTNVSLVLMGIGFLYKVYEFICNRFCFVDAYLMMLYKTALEQDNPSD